MKQLILIVIFSLSLGFVKLQTKEDEEFCDLFEPDELVDDLMKGVERELPLNSRLPQINWFITLHDGRVSRINSLKRASKTINTCTKDYMNLRVSLKNSHVIRGFYRWSKRLILSGGLLSGVAHTWIKRMDLKLDITVPFNGKPATIKALDVDGFRGVGVRVDGLGIFSNMASNIATDLANRFKSQIVSIIERAIAKIFTRDFVSKVMRSR